MIVVEGPDGSGKTTLCKNICEDFNLAMGERSTRDRDKLYEVTRTDTARAIYEELKCDAPPLVWDRLGPISDPIYAPIQGRKTGFNFNEQRFFFCTLQYLSLMILCLPPLETVIENSHKEHQMRGVTGNEELIYRHYRQLHPPLMRGVHYFQYDYTRQNYSAVALVVNAYLQERRYRECLSSSTPATSASQASPAGV